MTAVLDEASKFATNILDPLNWTGDRQGSKRNADGTVTMTFRVDGLDEIVRWIVGWAGRVKVVAPLPLREKVLDQHRRAIAFQG